jgi:4a-hydroxytetrahydrobiopterin dehydratase
MADGIAEQIASLNGWTHDNGMIRKTYTFKDFTESVGWTVRIAFLAEAHAHHPDIDIRWNKVTLALVTHDAGNQVTQKDIDLARAIDEV